MKRSITLIVMVLCYNAAMGAAGEVNAVALSPGARLNNAAAPDLLFTVNDGQVTDDRGNPRPDILFTAHSGGAGISLTATGIYYQFSKTDFQAGDERKNRNLQESLTNRVKRSTHRFSLSLAGANLSPIIRREAQTDYTEHFYLAHCPQGITGVHTYRRIVYENVYPGIDWIIYSKGTGMKYDFIVHPGADPSLIRLKVSDAGSSGITAAGELLIKTSLGEVKEAAPLSFCAGRQVETHFVQDEHGIKFAVSSYDKRSKLTIDPSVSWATYYGGTNDETGNSCAVDKSGNVYLAGTTQSDAGIASGGFKNALDGAFMNAFIVKFNSAGSRLWATYYGGSGVDRGSACAVDVDGNVYVAGTTTSTTGVAAAGFKNSFGGGSTDAFLVKFNSTGIRKWATYYGSNGYEQGNACITDGSANVYLAGYTTSQSGIATGNGFQQFSGGNNYGDAFLVKFDSSGNRLWGTFCGGANDEYGQSCTVDATDNVYLAGYTKSSDLPTDGYQNQLNGGYDAFLIKYNSAGDRQWATYYGGEGEDRATCSAVDGNGNVYIAGYTNSATGIATAGAAQAAKAGAFDGFLVQFNSAGAPQWATYYGAALADGIYSCTADGIGNVYIAGATSSTDLPVPNAIQPALAGNNDAFLAKWSSAGVCQWATYYGGSGEDMGNACALDGSGNIYIAGATYSSYLPGIETGGGFQTTFGGGFDDAFLAKIQIGPTGIGNIAVPESGTMTLYPNPAANQCTLEVFLNAANAGKPVSIILMNNLGQHVYTTEIQPAGSHFSYTIPFAGTLANGIYSLKLSVNGVEIIRPVMLHR